MTTEVSVRRVPGSVKARVLPDLRGCVVLLSKHALSTMEHRNVTPQQVYDVLHTWENRWVSEYYQGVSTPGTYVYQAGQLAVVVLEGPSVLMVKTVLMRRPDQWNDEQARNRH